MEQSVSHTSSEDRLEQQEVRRRIVEAMNRKAFPPAAQNPEDRHDNSLVSSLFSWPVIVWVSECLRASNIPHCIMPGCSCSPGVKEYKQRVVEDVHTKCHLLYVKYQCTGETKGCFSTVNADYIQSEARLLMHFPFVMSKKGGFSKEFMELIHEGMMSPHGLSSTVDHIRRRREKRYYKLLCLFGDRVGQLQLSNRTYLAPSPPSVGQYCSKQNPIGAETMSAAWMQSTNIYSSLCEQVMSSLKVRKALRVDHFVKFCKRLKVWPDGTGKRESMSDAKMLLLVQNEIGQIVGRRLTRSENHDETREILLHVRSAFSGTEIGSKYVISDHANGIRNLVSSVFDSSVGVRQDPFHVIQRFTEKIKDQKVKKTLSKQLHNSMFSVDGALREPTQMSSRFLNVVGSISSKDINCSESEWQGSVNSNLKKFERGNLYVEDNIYREGGGKDVRVVSTSQLEGFHSALKKMLARSVSANNGLRILDIFILQHNLKVGSNYGRNPPMHHADILTLAQTATLCRGIIAESPQLEFVNQLVSKPLRQSAYLASTVLDYGFERWRQIFETARFDTQALEANLHHTRQDNDSIKELLLKQIAFTKTGKLSKADFFNSLCLAELVYEAAAGFSSQERALLRQVQTEQELARRNLSECPLDTTLMYNIAVFSNSNQRLKLRHRSFATLAPKINSIRINTICEPGH
ncbi:hypothetical protein F444_01715 [Phytophthora nicotianae P1976]|uniref:MULE transposase domain-containing protein n=1 Tax=Phytophthora nicotianae P1976 TaxID=1317066 RepID=A0A081AZQ0_PHYNI|nr:hypothetical protein F444_01715 [Phytophthora nicotianae P1976]